MTNAYSSTWAAVWTRIIYLCCWYEEWTCRSEPQLALYLILTCSWYMNGMQTLDIYVKNTLFIDANAGKIILKTIKRNRLKHSSKEGQLSFCFPTARSRLIWNLLCYSIVRYKQRKMQVMQMVLTVRGTSQVPVYSGWVFSWVPLSFLGSSNVSLRSRLYLQRSQSPHSAAFRGLATCYVQYVWLDSGVQKLKSSWLWAVLWRDWTAV